MCTTSHGLLLSEHPRPKNSNGLSRSRSLQSPTINPSPLRLLCSLPQVLLLNLFSAHHQMRDVHFLKKHGHFALFWHQVWHTGYELAHLGYWIYYHEIGIFGEFAKHERILPYTLVPLPKVDKLLYLNLPQLCWKEWVQESTFELLPFYWTCSLAPFLHPLFIPHLCLPIYLVDHQLDHLFWENSHYSNNRWVMKIWILWHLKHRIIVSS